LESIGLGDEKRQDAFFGNSLFCQGLLAIFEFLVQFIGRK